MRDGLIFELLPGEKVIADRGYCDGRNFTVTPTDGDSEEEKAKMKAIRTCHETCNVCFKAWRVLQGKFRHGRQHHGDCFRAVNNITQMMLVEGHPLFEINENT